MAVGAGEAGGMEAAADEAVVIDGEFIYTCHKSVFWGKS